ncbi:MurR/RpiR family transcriptional regulator [Vibrio sp. SS-MA-C1-2]|uniref:MurR/RpiR family transcriptional regulator n=1 Tax=Vibrio sp. SS-MA-C1-2 TaxID=2908646 RepID=UPI001F2B997B|nr:MurR/RpiR family transcriptional regulator [Vibrio sp. SS-MA-C1-2]UJF17601.1 MurR/RpiR family transcriptional regulator [Vibrio sp. SS-MA-C1-2]
MNIIDKVQQHLEHFSKSERKVAEVILAEPEVTIHSSIATLARMADVSEPTVNRFCRRLDTKGFPDFKLHLAQSLANGTLYVNRNIEELDGPEAYTSKIFESTIACLDLAKNTISHDEVNRAVDLLTQAKKISFFGLGASASVCHDALNKFFRFNIPVVSFDDVVMQRMSCINCHEGDVFVFISYTGRTQALVDIAKLARENGGVVIGITATGSPLDIECDATVHLDIPEDTDAYMPMASRVVQMTVIDVLATGFTLRRGNGFRDNLNKVKAALRDARFGNKLEQID